jgi:D-aminoacyl-tRNA deacylase
MRVVVQRVTSALVVIDHAIKRRIENGLVVLAGFEDNDSLVDFEWMSGKIVRLRIFNDSSGIMNKSVQDIRGNIMLISQFTLHASTKKGNRPSYIKAAKPTIAKHLYEKFIISLENVLGKKIITGEFGADMQIELINDGPVTIYIDSKNKE